VAHDPPRILLIETSGQVGRVAVALGSSVPGEKSLDETRRHARDLAPAVADLLEEQDWRARDLDAVFVSLGPGSYTGLRVGVMSAKTLAYATGCAAVGVPTFHTIARQFEGSAMELAVTADAQKDKLYVQRFRRERLDHVFTPVDELAVVSGPDWVASLGPNVVVAGPGSVKAAAWLPAGHATIDDPASVPTVRGLLAVGLDRYNRRQRDDPLGLEPLYHRRSSAEEQWDRLTGR
jgi:tRNA threonylcarbamoyladenosine biosynthesis protein TsaB